MAFGLCAGNIRSLNGPIGQLKGSWGWWTDGSLRANGGILVPAMVRAGRVEALVSERAKTHVPSLSFCLHCVCCSSSLGPIAAFSVPRPVEWVEPTLAKQLSFPCLSTFTSKPPLAAPCLQRSGVGSKLTAGEGLYGSEFLPLKPFDVITMVTDTLGGTLRYFVNGMDAGIAFGPPGSGAVCELPDEMALFPWDADVALFPSCSLTNDKQVSSLPGTWHTRLGVLCAAAVKRYVLGCQGQITTFSICAMVML